MPYYNEFHCDMDLLPNVTLRRNSPPAPYVTLRKKTDITVIGKHIMYIITEEHSANKLFHYLRTTRMFEEYCENIDYRKTRFYDIPMSTWYGITGLTVKHMVDLLRDMDNVYVMGKHENSRIVVLRNG